MGRRKIDMKLVDKLDSRQVTFSKRRTGVFNKANELAILCGIMVVVIVFSIGGKPYTFGNPDVNTVIDRFISDYEEEDQEVQDYASVNNLNKIKEELKDWQKKLEKETKREKMLNKKLAKLQSFDDMNFKELVEMKESLEKYNDYVNEKVKVKAMEDDLEASEALLLLAEGPTIFSHGNRDDVDNNNNNNYDD
ncbi:hypothetical protein ACFE04_018595 [Oxalis oulophora]